MAALVEPNPPVKAGAVYPPESALPVSQTDPAATPLAMRVPDSAAGFSESGWGSLFTQTS